MRAHPYEARVLGGFNTMLNGILDQRLEQERGHLAIQGGRLNHLLDTQLIAKSSLLNFNVALDKLQFLPKGDLLPFRLAKSDPKQSLSDSRVASARLGRDGAKSRWHSNC